MGITEGKPMKLMFSRTGKLTILFLASFLGFSWQASAVQALTEEERNTIQVFGQASRGVVHIDVRVSSEGRFDKRVRESGTGTGFIVDRDGHILTAFHVIRDMNQVDVILDSGKRLPARVVGTAPQLDIALLHADIGNDELFPLPFGDSRSLQVGQKTLAIGNAIGLHNTLTVGVVSAVGRTVEGAPIELQEALIQTDSAINPGNSGGPLLDSAGQVIGINTAVIEKSQNIGFAIPIHFAAAIMPDLIEMGHPYRPQLGVSGSEITPNLARLFGLSIERGVMVEEVLPGSPAAAAGLQAGARVVMVADRPHVLGGDIITAINGEPITSSSQLSRLLLQSHPGQTLRITIFRDGRHVELSLQLKTMQMQF